MMIGPITSVAALLSLQVLYVLPAAYTFPQSIDNVATSEICRFVAAGSLQMQEVKNNKETFREHEEYINEWVINIIEGSDVADEIAEKHGFLNVGLISHDKEEQDVGLYKFVLKEEEVFLMPRYAPYQKKTQLLTMEENVLSAKQMTVQIQCSKINGKHTEREKRQSRATNLRTTWINSERVIFSWDHPEPPPNYYRLTHSAIDISDGTVTTSYRFLLVPATQQSVTLAGVNRDDINIFHLNALYDDAFYSAIFLNEQATLPAPANTEIDTRDCSSMQTSWQPPSTVGTYTYALVAYNGSSIIFQNVGSATSHIVADLTHLSTYIVFIVAMSGNDYGASYEILTLESVRLVDGVRSCEGRVEVYRGGQWGTVCDRLWGIDEADVVCSQVNCGNTTSPTSPRFGVGTGPILMTNVQCQPGDDCIEHCPHLTSTTGCTHSRDVSVTCGDPPTAPPTDPTSPTTPPPIPVTCPPGPSINNGNLVSTGFTPGETLTYSCFEGYQLVGNPVRTCLGNGEWSGQEPVCNPCPSSGCTADPPTAPPTDPTSPTTPPPIPGRNDPYLLCANTMRISRVMLDGSGFETVYSDATSRIIVSLDYHYREDYMYWSDVTLGTLNRAHLNGSNAEVLLNNNEDPVIDGIAVDWVNYKLYWTEATLGDVLVMDIETRTQKRLISNPDDAIARAIAVDPATRYMYWSDWGSEPRIERAGMDGSNRSTLHNTSLVWPNGLTLDYPNQILYWIDASLDTIEYSNVDGSGRTLLERMDGEIYHPFSLTLKDEYIYWTDWDQLSIFKTHKDRPNDPIVPVYSGLTQRPFGIEVVSPDRQPEVPNPCDNAKCPSLSLCLLSPTSPEGYTCVCPDPMEECESHSCSQLSDPENGTVTVIDSTATYTCNSGHQLSGDQTRTCENGVWSGEQPTCPLIVCEISGQVYMECGTACPAVCGEENVDICTLQCVSGCQCPLGTILDRKSAQCVTECPLPNPPVNVRLSQENSSSLRVQWEHSCDGPPITHYLINYISFESDFTLITNQSIIVHKSSILAIIVNLHNIPAGSIHTVIVIAVHGRISVSSKPAHLHIFIPTVPPVLCNCPPTINEVIQVSPSSLGLTWSHPCCVPPTTHYIITVVHVSTRSNIVQRPLYITVFPSVTSWVFTDLNLGAGNIYIFVVTAVSGDVSLSSVLVYFTHSNTLGIDPPTNVNVVSLTSSARVSWMAPQLADFTNYYIFYAPVAVNGGRTLREYVSSRDISDTLRGLNEGVTYVAVVIDRGSTPSASEPVMFTI